MNFNLKNLSRSTYLTGAVIFIFGIFVIRLFYIQIIQHDYYQDQANAEQIKRLVIPAERGRIFALDGQEPVTLVMNETIYTVFADPKIIDEPEKIIDTVKSVGKEKTKENIADLIKLTDTRYQIIASKLTRAQADEIKSKKYKGIGFQASTRRVYPEGSMAAQVLGFVNYDGLGQYGVEGALNDRLKGKDGLLQSVTDVRDVPLTIGDQNIKIPKVNGDDIVLSIDRNIQAKAEAAAVNSIAKTKAEHVNIVIMDPNNGQVKAMVNYPWYNPNDIANVADSSLFNNAVISNQYEPGSVMKSFTIVRGIDKGFITPATTYLNTDYVTIDDRVISNATKGKTGIITMQDVYNMSLNTGTVEIMKIFGGGVINLQSRKILYDFFHDSLGLGDYTGIELSGENPGTLIGPDTGDGDAVRYSNMSFGQGMDVTLIQAAAAYSAVINGGTYYQPTILAGKMNSTGDFIKNSPTVKRKNIVSEASSRTLKNMAIIGRQTKTKEDLPGYEVGGKTGTSQMIVNGSYSNAETTGSYLGFGGNEQAKYVIMITEYGKNQPLGGLHDCLPVFTEISNWLIGYLNIKPKG